MRTCLVVLMGLAVAGVVAVGFAADAPAASDSASIRCKAGFRHAVIAGRHRCLKAGQRCARRYDRQYHRYGFHCHGSRLTRRRPPVPPPPPPPPPPPQPADVAITNTDAPDPVTVGANLTYTITVTNGGPGRASAVQVTDMLPTGVTFISTTATQGSCTGTTTVVCALGDVASGASAFVSIVVQPTTSGTLTNAANVTTSAQDPNSANNAATQTTTVNPIP